jgi:hypothetical protein
MCIDSKNVQWASYRAQAALPHEVCLAPATGDLVQFL